jgi:hypothetical protein
MLPNITQNHNAMTDRQTELLEKEDPRFYAIGKLNTGIGSIATIEKVGKEVLSFGLPSSPGLFLNLALNSKRQIDKINFEDCFDKHPAPQGTYPENHEMLFNFIELMMSQIIFSHSAIETFANIKIPNEFLYRTKRSDKKFIEEYNKDQVERYVSLDDKLDKVLPQIFNVKTPKGTKLWENYQNLKKLRDRLIHLKSRDMSASGPEIKTIWGDLMRNQKTDFTKQVHELIGHFISKETGHRWYKKFPYK